jgi:hypothetical protein
VPNGESLPLFCHFGQWMNSIKVSKLCTQHSLKKAVQKKWYSILLENFNAHYNWKVVEK